MRDIRSPSSAARRKHTLRHMPFCRWHLELGASHIDPKAVRPNVERNDSRGAMRIQWDGGCPKHEQVPVVATLGKDGGQRGAKAAWVPIGILLQDQATRGRGAVAVL